MKSWISKALLGLFIAAPSVMARLPSTNGTVGGIYLKSKGMTTSETRMLQNSLGLWLSGMVWDLQPGRSMYRYQAYPDGAAATITVEKINAVSPQLLNGCDYGGVDVPKCYYDIARTKNAANEDVSLYVKVYTQGTSGNNLLNTPLRFQNLMTGIIGDALLENNYQTHKAYWFGRVAIPNGCHDLIRKAYNSGSLPQCEINAGFQRLVQYYNNGKFEMTASGNYASHITNTWYDTASIPAGATLQYSRYILPIASAGWEPGAYSIGLPQRANSSGNLQWWSVKNGSGITVPHKCTGAEGGATFGYLFPTEIAPDPYYNKARILQDAGMQVSQVFRVEHSSGTDVLGNTNGTCNTFLGYALDVLNGN